VKLKKLIGALFSTGIGYGIGYVTGKSIHDFLAYILPLKYFSKYQWFDYKSYLNLYTKYSSGLPDIFPILFGITFAGISLATYLGLKK